jgi:hypothetical protein
MGPKQTSPARTAMSANAPEAEDARRGRAFCVNRQQWVSAPRCLRINVEDYPRECSPNNRALKKVAHSLSKYRALYASCAKGRPPAAWDNSLLCLGKTVIY